MDMSSQSSRETWRYGHCERSLAQNIYRLGTISFWLIVSRRLHKRSGVVPSISRSRIGPWGWGRNSEAKRGLYGTSRWLGCNTIRTWNWAKPQNQVLPQVGQIHWVEWAYEGIALWRLIHKVLLSNGSLKYCLGRYRSSKILSRGRV